MVHKVLSNFLLANRISEIFFNAKRTDDKKTKRPPKENKNRKEKKTKICHNLD